MEFVLPWYIAGPLLGLMVPALLLLSEKQLGVSSTLRLAGRFVFPKWDYFNYSWYKDVWQLKFVLGITLSALVFGIFDLFYEPETTTAQGHGLLAHAIYSINNWAIFLSGGLLIGFGARYAGGCTAGHCIMGGAQLATSSIVTTISFFIGGLVTSYFIIPQIFPS